MLLNKWTFEQINKLAFSQLAMQTQDTIAFIASNFTLEYLFEKNYTVICKAWYHTIWSNWCEKNWQHARIKLDHFLNFKKCHSFVKNLAIPLHKPFAMPEHTELISVTLGDGSNFARPQELDMQPYINVKNMELCMKHNVHCKIPAEPFKHVKHVNLYVPFNFTDVNFLVTHFPNATKVLFSTANMCEMVIPTTVTDLTYEIRESTLLPDHWKEQPGLQSLERFFFYASSTIDSICLNWLRGFPVKHLSVYYRNEVTLYPKKIPEMPSLHSLLLDVAPTESFDNVIAFVKHRCKQVQDLAITCYPSKELVNSILAHTTPSQIKKLKLGMIGFFGSNRIPCISTGVISALLLQLPIIRDLHLFAKLQPDTLTLLNEANMPSLKSLSFALNSIDDTVLTIGNAHSGVSSVAVDIPLQYLSSILVKFPSMHTLYIENPLSANDWNLLVMNAPSLLQNVTLNLNTPVSSRLYPCVQFEQIKRVSYNINSTCMLQLLSLPKQKRLPAFVSTMHYSKFFAIPVGEIDTAIPYFNAKVCLLLLHKCAQDHNNLISQLSNMLEQEVTKLHTSHLQSLWESQSNIASFVQTYMKQT